MIYIGGIDNHQSAKLSTLSKFFSSAMGNKGSRAQRPSRTITTSTQPIYTPSQSRNKYSSSQIKTKIIETVIESKENDTAKAFKDEYDAVLKIEYTVHGFARLKYEELHNQYVPVGIKSMIIKYCGYFFIDSAILNGNEKIILSDNILKDIINSNNNDGIHLLFRASRDGFDEKTFHKLCDQKGATVIIVKNQRNEIFGGYTGFEWISSSDQRQSYSNYNNQTAFIFSIRNGNKLYIGIQNCDGILNYSHYGASFGINNRNLDLFICGNSDTNPASHAKGIGIKSGRIENYEVFCLKSEYIEMYKQYTAKLNAMINERRLEMENKRKEYKRMPLLDGINDEDIYSLSDEEDEVEENKDQQILDDILKKREQEIISSIQ